MHLSERSLNCDRSQFGNSIDFVLGVTTNIFVQRKRESSGTSCTHIHRERKRGRESGKKPETREEQRTHRRCSRLIRIDSGCLPTFKLARLTVSASKRNANHCRTTAALTESGVHFGSRARRCTVGQQLVCTTLYVDSSAVA